MNNILNFQIIKPVKYNVSCFPSRSRCSFLNEHDLISVEEIKFVTVIVRTVVGIRHRPFNEVHEIHKPSRELGHLGALCDYVQ